MTKKKEIKELDSAFKDRVNKNYPIMAGYSRCFCKCSQCGLRAYYDYVPFSLSHPVITTNCLHDFKEYIDF